MTRENEPPIYDIEYFKGLGFRKKEALVFVKSWNRKKPQTPEEVRQGIRVERENREASFNLTTR